MGSPTALLRGATREHRLENGLTLLVHEDRTSPVVAIVTHVKAGYFNEPDRLVGISHVLEHMYFKGTERRGVGEMARETKTAGGYLNAGTIYDYTSYYTVLPSASLELGLDIQADALKHSSIDEEELRRELLVIIQEAKRKLDNPSAVAAESLYEEMFDEHPIRRWRIGTEEGLARLRREDVWEYYRNLYRPSNIILAVAGDVDPERTLELVERYYDGMPAGEPVKHEPPAEPARRGFRFREMAGDIMRTHAEWGWRTPGTLDDDTPALDLLSVILGQGRAARLYQRVREAGWVTSIGAYNYTPTSVGVFGISAELLPEDTTPALEAMWTAVVELAGAAVHDSEVERARNILEARLLRRLETVEGQANLLAEWQALGDWRLAERYHEALRKVAADDLDRVTRAYLTLDRATVLIYRPESAPRLGWTPAGLESRLDEAARQSEPEPVRPVAWAPATGAAAGLSWHEQGVEDGVHFYELANGVRVAIQPRGAAPLASMGMFVRGGTLDERADTAGLAGLMARASLKGTATRSAARIAEETEALGGAIMPGASADLLHWTLSVPSRHFEHAFELLADVALQPAFPEAEVERERKVALSDLDQLRDDMYRFPLRLFLQAAFQDHPYGFSLPVREAAMHRLGRADLLDWHRDRVLRSRPWVFVVGDVAPKRCLSVIAATMAAVRGDGVDDDVPPPSWPDGPRQEVEHRAKAQTALFLGFPGPARGDPDLYAFQVLSNVVSGLGGRLFEELRGRRSLAYSVAAYPVARRLAGAFVAYIATSPEQEDEARRGLLAEFERMAEEKVSAAELERAQRYTVGAWTIRAQTNIAHMADLADALLLGRGMADIREFEERISAVTAAGIRDLFRDRYDSDRLVEGIVRGTGASR